MISPQTSRHVYKFFYLACETLMCKSCAILKSIPDCLNIIAFQDQFLQKQVNALQGD